MSFWSAVKIILALTVQFLSCLVSNTVPDIYFSLSFTTDNYIYNHYWSLVINLFQSTYLCGQQLLQSLQKDIINKMRRKKVC